jgi:hypothetical protein
MPQRRKNSLRIGGMSAIGILLMIGLTACTRITAQKGAPAAAAPIDSMTLPYAVVGSDTLTRDDFLFFRDMIMMYPGKRLKPVIYDLIAGQAFHIEVAGLYALSHTLRAETLDSIRASLDQVWKRRIVAAQLYKGNLLLVSHGFSLQEIKDYFNANCHKFPVVDSTGATIGIVGKKVPCPDFDPYLPLAADSLWVSRYPIDLRWVRQVLINNGWSQDTIAKLIRTEPNKWWIEYSRRQAFDYALALAYEKINRKTLPADLMEIYGEGKLITPADYRALAAWSVEPPQPGLFDTAVVRQCIKDYLFCQLGESFSPEFMQSIQTYRDIMWRYDVASLVYNNVLHTTRAAFGKPDPRLFDMIGGATRGDFTAFVDSMVVLKTRLLLRTKINALPVHLTDRSLDGMQGFNALFEPIGNPAEYLVGQAQSKLAARDTAVAQGYLLRAYYVAEDPAVKRGIVDRIAELHDCRNNSKVAKKIRGLR